MNTQTPFDKQKIEEALKQYFTSLVHYQYGINNGEEGAETEFKREQEYQIGKIQSLFQTALREQREMIVNSLGNCSDGCKRKIQDLTRKETNE